MDAYLPLASSVDRPLYVLVADDHPDTVESWAILLRLFGYRVATAADGREAVEVASREQPEAAILDIDMPFLSGYDVARELRRQFGRSVTLIALTGNGALDIHERCLAAGFDHYFAKMTEPIKLDAILKRVAASR